MTKTYTPLIIEGKIYVVVDAPFKRPYDSEEWYNRCVAECAKYPTLPEHAPYWKERIGQPVEVEIGKDFHTGGQLITEQGVYYAIPPQQKQGDEWDEAEEMIESDFGIPIKNLTGEAVIFYLRNNYNLTKK